MTTPDLHQFWQETLSDWQASGLSGAAYCKQESLVYHRFVYWRQKLTGRVESSEPVQARSGFARVAPIPDTGVGLTVSLPGGVSITGLHAGNIDLLGAVLRQL
ncbi:MULTISPECIES: IS66 family insertion sequence element accessory protein TnpB [Pseudomonadota]|uniref:IS66 family insertion sequence element accessory protein TnpA n=1 Tax=Pseudomonadota TaxID=1224 RepID=UPI0029432851|nr:IS66 family insertion sequence element accessory protein TnpB [Marinobacter salarius]WOI18076.1 IS66 family insertion sequence element accessory protein TnpB [Marinobacter salarius]WOI18338.1 IS66 family insertion sequence element accessory protein TnpB [Marinobacter salarius]WOI19406.1 IS66 family insertion sequence element accessory protein TnpB [Marinobacter salarius]WOI20797.1 IS66 family insertion sequence element accessory protein TnpB [Marinobacter salarius]